MRTSDLDILVIPGLGGSGPDHWQSRWEAKLSTARRVELGDLDRPHLASWAGRIVEAVDNAARPVVLVAHSLGVWAVAHGAGRFEAGRVRGALLVAPPSAEGIRQFPQIDPAFVEFQPQRLDFPALLVASRNDSLAGEAQSRALAQALGAEFVDAGDSGHLNVDSGHGPWPEGLMRFGGFLKTL
ncbi:MAG: alpha/beta hydrolase [Rhodospirillales bacterium 20-64-7]|nr:MAG: alpha/beta hydrolase [Rhodospirillales bacterium 20-64-7]